MNTCILQAMCMRPCTTRWQRTCGNTGPVSAPSLSMVLTCAAKYMGCIHSHLITADGYDKVVGDESKRHVHCFVLLCLSSFLRLIRWSTAETVQKSLALIDHFGLLPKDGRPFIAHYDRGKLSIATNRNLGVVLVPVHNIFVASKLSRSMREQVPRML